MLNRKSSGFLIAYISRQAHRYYREKFNEFGLNRGSTYILKRLYDQDGINQNALSCSAHLDKANITRSISKLLKMGFVTKVKDCNDQRANLIFLTDKAKGFETDFIRIYSNWNKVLLENFAPEKREEIYQILQKISENTEDFLNNVGEVNVK